MYFDRRLFSFTAGLRWRIALSALVGLVAIPVAIWRLTLTGQTMAKVFRGASIGDVGNVLVLIAILIILRAGLQVFKEETAQKTSAQMKVKLRGMLYEHVLRLGPGHFDQRRTGDATLSLVEGVETMETFYGLYLPQLVIAGLAPVIIFAFMAFLDVRTALVFLCFAFFTLLAPSLFHRMNRDSSMRRRRDYAALGSDFLDSMQGLPTLKVFGQSKSRGVMLAERARQVYRSTMWVLSVNLATGGVTLLGISAGAAVALAWGALRVDNGTLELKTLLVVLLLGVEVFRPLREMTVLYHQGMMATAAARGIFDLLDTPPEVVDAAPAETVAGPELESSVRFEHVTFGYQGGKRPALQDFSFDLEPGRTLGIVGPSGAGKSTIINLLLRFVEPQEGRVFLGERELQDIHLDELRQHIAVVTQDTYLFHGTIAANLRLGKPGASDEELIAAARNANIHDFIERLPDGYNTMVGERGARLSGGQRQRIAIARALLKNAPILVLDEALSSVDAENEHSIQQALDRLQQGRTTLVIAHRLSSVANAHRILVLDRGRLVEDGTAGELARAGGVYARLMAAQFSVDADAEAAAVAVATDEGHHSANGYESHAAAETNGLAHAGANGNGHSHDNGHAHENGHADETGTGHSHKDHDHAIVAGNGASDGTNSHVHSRGAASADGVGHAHEHGGDAVPGEELAKLAVVQRQVPLGELARRLLKLVLPWKGEMVLCLITGLANSTSTVALGALSALLVGRVASGGDTTFYMVALLVMVPVSAMLAWLDTWIAHDLAFRLLAEMRGALYRLLDRLAPAYLLRRRTGDLVSAATGDIELIELFYAHTISPAFQAILVPGGVLVVLALIQPLLALVLLPFLALVAVTPLYAGKRMEKVGSDLRGHNGDLTAHMVDSVQGLRTIAAFNHGPARLREIEAGGIRLGWLKRRFFRSQSIQNAIIECLTALGALSVMTAGAALVSRGDIARSELPLATLLALYSFAPVTSIVTVAKELMQTVAAARRFFAVEDEVPTVSDGDALAPALDDAVRGLRLSFEHVTFRYAPGEAPALDDVSFDAPGGTTIALVGRSGAGKTTAAHLLLRFWDPQSGRILLGEGDIREFQLDELRKLVALVAQDTYLFNTTLWENLKLGHPDATDEEVRRAAAMANVTEFAEALPEGYETMVGERGTQLSGGQRQRVAIARALLKDAPVLVLDEATSHLDAVNEAEVREALDRLMAGRTTLVIAHRLSTIRNADRIVVLDGGHVAEHGSHQELLALDGLYSHLISHQLLSRREDEVAPILAGATAEASGGGHAHHHH